MWYRLKSSLLTAFIASLLVLGMKGLAEPVVVESVAPTTLRLAAPSDRAAFALAVQLAALALDAAVEARTSEAADRRPAAVPPAKADRSHTLQRTLRMPFYSFAARSPRTRES